MNKTIQFDGSVLLAAILLVSMPVSAQNAIPAPRQTSPIALIGGTIHTITGDVIENGTIVFDKGTIVTIGSSVELSPTTERVYVAGKHVYPGLIDAYNSIGLTEIGGGSAGTVDMGETGKINPSVHVEVAVHPESEHIPVARSGGVTVAAVAPRGGLISGFSAAMMLEGWTWEEMMLKTHVGLIVNWPDMLYIPRPFSRQTKEAWVKKRDADLAAITETFENARAYMRMKETAMSKNEQIDQTDPGLEALIPVLRGDVPIIVNAYAIAEIQAALQFSEAQNVRLVLAGAYDAWRIAPLLKEKGIPVIFTNVQNARRRWEGYDAVFSAPKKFMDAGLQYCITGSRTSSNTRNLSHQAAHASAFGLPRDEALRAITLYPARILGIDDRVGSLETGKDATLFIADGDVLEISTHIEQVYIRGRKVDMRDKHVRLYEKYREKYRQLDAQQ